MLQWHVGETGEAVKREKAALLSFHRSIHWHESQAFIPIYANQSANV